MDISAKEAVEQEVQAIALYDDFCWLLGEIQRSLEPIAKDLHIQDPHHAQDTVATAIELLQTLPGEKLADFTKTLSDHLEELLAPLLWLHNSLMPWRKRLSTEMESRIIAAWQNDSGRLEDFPPSLQKTVAAIGDTLALFHRTSSLAESLHSWLRPFLTVHRSMPDWLLALLQLYWNHHVFSRGKRAGSSPLQLAGIEDVPTLTSVFDTLFENPAMA